MDCVREDSMRLDLECIECRNETETLSLSSRAIIHIFAGSNDKWI